MDTTGSTFHNPVTKEWGRILIAAHETGGSHIVCELLAPPTARPPGEHLHPRQEERFEVLEGRLSYRVDGREGIAGPGEVLTVPPGTRHDWWNAGPGVARARVTVTPPMRFADAVVTVWGLAALGRTDGEGMPGLVDGLLLAEAFHREMLFTTPPPALVVTAARVVGPLARALGRRVDTDEVRRAAQVAPERWPGAERSELLSPA